MEASKLYYDGGILMSSRDSLNSIKLAINQQADCINAIAEKMDLDVKAYYVQGSTHWVRFFIELSCSVINQHARCLQELARAKRKSIDFYGITGNALLVRPSIINMARVLNQHADVINRLL